MIKFPRVPSTTQFSELDLVIVLMRKEIRLEALLLLRYRQHMPHQVAFKNLPGFSVSPSFNALLKSFDRNSFGNRIFLLIAIPNYFGVLWNTQWKRENYWLEVPWYVRFCHTDAQTKGSRNSSPAVIVRHFQEAARVGSHVLKFFLRTLQVPQRGQNSFHPNFPVQEIQICYYHCSTHLSYTNTKSIMPI